LAGVVAPAQVTVLQRWCEKGPVMPTTRELIHPVIDVRDRVFLLKRRYRRSSDRIGYTADQVMAPAYAAGAATLFLTLVAGLSGLIPLWAVTTSAALGVALLTVPLQFGAGYVAVSAAWFLLVRTAALSARRVHSLYRVSPNAAAAAWHTPAPYRPRSLGGRIRLPASPEEVAARRAADVLRQQLTAHGVDADTASLLSGLHVSDDVSLGDVLDVIAGLDPQQRAQALRLAGTAGRSVTYLREHAGENPTNVSGEILAAYVQARPSRHEQEAIERLWPTWAGSVEALLAASHTL
jgi:hypothetical protein